MRESRTYGFVRGAPSDRRPYRDQKFQKLLKTRFLGKLGVNTMSMQL